MSDKFSQPGDHPSHAQPSDQSQDQSDDTQPSDQSTSQPTLSSLPKITSAPGGSPRSWLKLIARYAPFYVAVFLLFRFVIPSYMVEGSSMEPTYQPEGDRVLTDGMVFKLLDGPQRGEVVILDKSVTQGFAYNDDSLIKRVIGLPGEKIEVRHGTVYINDEPLVEPYVVNHAEYDYPATTLPAGCFFVLGDNRPVSLDSHYFGCVNRDKTLAKVLLKYPHF